MAPPQLPPQYRPQHRPQHRPKRLHEAFDAWLQRDAGRPFLFLSEGELMSHPPIEMAAVLGRPLGAEDAGNEDIVAFVALRPGHSLNPAALHDHLRQHLAPYKRPQRIEVLPQLPMTASGQVMKRELRALL